MTGQCQEIVKKTEQYFNNGYNCAQAVALSNLEVLEGKTEGIIQLAAGLGHGMNAGCTCGALSGGVLTIGMLMAGKDTKGFDKAIARVTAELHRRFVEEFKTTCCRGLRKKLSPFKNARCKQITIFTAALTFELLQEAGIKANPNK